MKRVLSLTLAFLNLFCACGTVNPVSSSTQSTSSKVASSEVSSSPTLEDFGFEQVYSPEKPVKIDYEYEKLTSLSGLNIVNLGDSIFGNFRGASSVSSRINWYTGATCHNGGIGGATWGFSWNFKDYYTMHRMAYYISTGDFNPFHRAVNSFTLKENPNSYIAETYRLLADMNWEEVDVITISYGTNDFTNQGLITGNESMKYREYFTTPNVEKGLFKACSHYYLDDAIKYSLNAIRTKYPHIRIVVTTPTPRYDYIDKPINLHGYALKDYCEHIKKVCEEWGVPCLDAYNEVGINDQNYKQYFFENDFVHLNEQGRDLLAKYISDNLLDALNSYCE